MIRPSRLISRTSASLVSATSFRVCCSSPTLARSCARAVSSAASESLRRRSRTDAPASSSISARPAKAVPTGASGEAGAGASDTRQVRPPSSAKAVAVPPGPCATTVGPSVTRTPRPSGSPVREARTSSSATTAPATSPIRAFRRSAAVRSGSSLMKTGTNAKTPIRPSPGSRTGAERRGCPVVLALRSASPREGSEPRSSTSTLGAAGSWRTSGNVKAAPAGAAMRICSVVSTSPRCAAATLGTQPTVAISGRANGTRAWVENALGSTDDEAS